MRTIDADKAIERLNDKSGSVPMPDDAWAVLCKAAVRGDKELGNGIMEFVYQMAVKECVRRIDAMASEPPNDHALRTGGA